MPSIRTAHVRSSNGTVHAYPQLVESFRNDRGKPSVRVLLPLTGWAPEHVENLRVALQANRLGRALVLPVDAPAVPPKADQCLRYLDLAVVLEMWDHWRLGPLMDTLLSGTRAVASSKVVAALVAHRCVAPASKLAAEGWYPETALVELLGVDPSAMNNDRFHRVLSELEQAETALMDALAERYAERDGRFATLFCDVTDTWFEGHGPALAESGKTKLGHVRRKIGIVLLCNEHGYPLRWSVVAGNRHDSKTMIELLGQQPTPSWLHDIPVVVDRALGKPAHLRVLADMGLRFVTAMTADQITPMAGAGLAAVDVGGPLPEDPPEAIEQAAMAALRAGFQRIDRRLFVRDIGRVEVDMSGELADANAAEADDADADAGAQEASAEGLCDKTVQAMTLARQIRALMAEPDVDSYAHAGRLLGIDRFLAGRVARLLALPEAIQQQILDGAAVGLSLNELYALSSASNPAEQRRDFERLCASCTPVARPLGRRAVKPPAPPLLVRLVAYFNPEIFVERRRKAQERLDRLRQFVEQLNNRLLRPRSRRGRDSASGALHAFLRRESLVDVVEFKIVWSRSGTRKRPQVRYSLRADAWQRRVRNDGICLIAADPRIEASAEQLCRLYRAKDAIEKDFESLKSNTIISVRPVRHRTDLKVRAHVTLCMIALLIERTLARRLNDSTDVHSAAAALELLSSCRLNRYTYPGTTITHYVTPRLAPTQRNLLHLLGMSHLADDQAIAARITSR